MNEFREQEERQARYDAIHDQRIEDMRDGCAEGPVKADYYIGGNV